MNGLELLPSVNWNASRILVINSSNTVCAYGTRGDIVLIKNINQDDFSKFTNKFIARAHKNCRITGLIFVKTKLNNENVELLASCGEDGRIKLWNIETEDITHKCLIKNSSNIPAKLIDIDSFLVNNCIVSIADNGIVAKWNINLNKLWIYTVDVKTIFSCIAACPHDVNLIALGAHHGLVIIYNLKGKGNVIHKIRCHHTDVISVSWCPVPYNSLQLSKLRENETFNEEEWKNSDKTLLLASCAKERTIYICKAGTNGYCESVITIPSKFLTNVSSSRTQTNINFQRARFIKWVNSFALLTFTDFNEMIILDLSFQTNQNVGTKQEMKVSKTNVNIKFLHNVHKKNINNFAVYSHSLHETDFQVWSCSADRLLVRSSYRMHYKERPIILPLLSGHVFSLAISPTNPDLLAIGCGDGRISILNLSTTSTIDVTTLSKKIDCKVMSIQWHPYYEGVFAFGTGEGRVGLFDISQGGSTPTIFKLYHNKPIYKLHWGPPMILDQNENVTDKSERDLYLFALGNGDILQFDTSDVNKVPISLNAKNFSSIEEACNCKIKTDFALNQDQQLIAIGLNNGDVCLCATNAPYKLLHIIVEQRKPIMSLAWHPIKVLDFPNEVSPCCNWLAVAGQNVLVYHIFQSTDNAPKKVASLDVHTNRILSLSWSPHINGRLLSCSADNTAIIWDVISQTIIGRYVQHYAQINCGVWNFCNKDYVITGSADFTCRMWSVSRDIKNKISCPKKKNDNPIEPTVLNAIHLKENADSTIIASNKTVKQATFFPTVNQEFHSCPLLDVTFEKAINKHKNISLSNESTSYEEMTFDECENHSQTNSSAEECSINNLNSTDCNYAQLFGNVDNLMNLIRHEEHVLSNNDDYVGLYVLNQAHYDLKNVILDAIQRNKVTENLLALAPSISPKLWKDACQVYIEQLIQSNDIFQATNFYLALGKDEEAITLLCDKNRFKEAFAIARLRGKDESALQNILHKWIDYCYSCGLNRLAAHCYMFLHKEQNACSVLNKSKLIKDTILAAKLLKYYESNRAIEAVIECVRRHLGQITLTEFQNLLIEFPEIKFMEPWYFMWHYFADEKPNTAAVTKWLIGLANNNLEFKLNTVDFERLEEIIVNNSFNMNYEELILYVSAQAALYICGISTDQYKQIALRHFIRGLFYCYNFHISNSNQIVSDNAFPMMRLLQLIFINGIKDTYYDKMEPSDNDESIQFLIKSINAYFCYFVSIWLISCNDLPKSLKLLRDESFNKADEELNAELENCFSIITNIRMKLKKFVELLELYITDILDIDTVIYYQNIAKLKLINDSAGSDFVDIKWQCLNDESDYVEIEKEVEDNKVEETKMINGNMHSNSNGKIINGNIHLNNNEIKLLRESVAIFEKKRLYAPNPFHFYYLLKQFILKHKSVEPELVCKLETTLDVRAYKCGILKSAS